MEKQKEKQNVYDIVTARITELMKQGTVPWQKPWTDAGIPRNLFSGRPYRGINVWLLSWLGFAQNLFLTFSQVSELGASVKKGEHGQFIVFWKQKEKKDKDEAEQEETDAIGKKYVLRYYYVFNISQCEGIPEDMLPELMVRDNDPIEVCEAMVERMPNKPAIYHQEHSAFYNPMMDYVNMPKMDTFTNSESYYGTLFHELIHSTGHQSRLNREGITKATSSYVEPYSVEELTAEIGACYLKSYAGIAVEMSNSVAYIQGWLKRLRNDHRFILFACSAAQKAADFILNPQEAKKEKVPVGAIDDDLPF